MVNELQIFLLSLNRVHPDAQKKFINMPTIHSHLRSSAPAPHYKQKLPGQSLSTSTNTSGSSRVEPLCRGIEGWRFLRLGERRLWPVRPRGLRVQTDSFSSDRFSAWHRGFAGEKGERKNEENEWFRGSAGLLL